MAKGISNRLMDAIGCYIYDAIGWMCKRGPSKASISLCTVIA
jgi:hypothetical protein